LSSDPSELIVPSSVTVPAGQTEATFDLMVPDDPDLDGTQTVIVTAAAPGHRITTARVQVFDSEAATLQVDLPGTTREGAGTVTALVSVSAAPAAGLAIELRSSDTNELIVPPVAIVPAGATSVAFVATVIDDTRLDGPQLVTVTAHVMNWTDGTATIEVLDNDP